MWKINNTRCYNVCEVTTMEKVKTSISLDKDVYEYIQQLAKVERLNISQVINKEFAVKMEKGK